MRILLKGELAFLTPQPRSCIDLSIQGWVELKPLLVQLGIPLGEIYLVAINGKIESLEQAAVLDQDTVILFPPVGGGSGTARL